MTRKTSLFYFWFLSFSVISVSCDLYASISDLELLLDTEKIYIRDLRDFIKHQENLLEFYREKLENYKSQNKIARNDREKYLANPLNAFSILKRMTVGIKNLINATRNKEFEEKVDGYLDQNYVTAEESDFVGSVMGILRLQKVYGLDTRNLSKGIIDGIQFTRELTRDDCLQIGGLLVKHKEYEHAIEWLKEALAKPMGEFTTFEGNKIDILENLVVAYNETRNFYELSNIVYDLLRISPGDPMATEFIRILNGNTWQRTFKERRMYEESCKGNRVLTPKQQASLKCYYVTNTTQFTKIAPIKAEVAFHNPRIIVFHDVLYDKEIELIKEISKNRFIRSGILSKSGSSVSEVRVSKVAWLPDPLHKLMPIMAKRTVDMTGLSMETSEQFQVQSYGIGGQYEFHTDFLKEYFHNGTELPWGRKIPTPDDRIATILFYLTDVELGGATVFPLLKVKVQPRKGTAVYWHNLYHSGGGHPCTLHAACPVLVGHKWAMNKWVHENAQIFRYPCQLKLPEFADCSTL